MLVFFPQVCGGHANASSNGTCHDSPCGGAGCRDNDGRRVCGGDGCDGTVSASLKGLKHANDVTDNLTAASEDLQGMAKKVCLPKYLTCTIPLHACTVS